MSTHPLDVNQDLKSPCANRTCSNPVEDGITHCSPECVDVDMDRVAASLDLSTPWGHR